MRALVLIALALLASCAAPVARQPLKLADSPDWPGQHQMPAEDVCEGSEDLPACVAEVNAERLASPR